MWSHGILYQKRTLKLISTGKPKALYDRHRCLDFAAWFQWKRHVAAAKFQTRLIANERRTLQKVSLKSWQAVEVLLTRKFFFLICINFIDSTVHDQSSSHCHSSDQSSLEIWNGLEVCEWCPHQWDILSSWSTSSRAGQHLWQGLKIGLALEFTHCLEFRLTTSIGRKIKERSLTLWRLT